MTYQVYNSNLVGSVERYELLTTYHPTLQAAREFALDLSVKFPEKYQKLILTAVMFPPIHLTQKEGDRLAHGKIWRGVSKF
jgi:hypothetical protein